MDYLKFEDKDYRIHGYIAALGHDLGKVAVIRTLKKQEEFTLSDMEEMMEHVGASSYFVEVIDPVAAAIIERHHYYQPNGYPKTLRTNSTREIEYMARMLAIIDFYDSASTRENDRFKISLISKLLRKRLPSKTLVKNKLIEAYRNLDVKYDGKILPKAEKKGNKFIEELYEVGIFGQKNPLNPFTEPFSFKYVNK